jgi:hypothetical protein
VADLGHALQQFKRYAIGGWRFRTPGTGAHRAMAATARCG